MSEMEKAYEPAKYEADIYHQWEESGAFEPSPGEGEPFCIIMPPPNANGSLHTGHAMFAVEDLLTRYMRMSGRPTLWQPGTDHAGIETQFVYERDVLAPAGKSRFDLGPERFYSELMKFTRANEGRIISQLKSLGFSADWSRLKFTLDDDVVETVYDTFKRLHDDGLIYRGNRIVNWCTRCNAAFADVEVKYVERPDEIYTLDYGSVTIATTRPETIFADVAVAVNPEDTRYSKLIGEMAVIPLLDRLVPIIGDDHVDSAFGTGALKVTPGHDANDYAIGKRHQLPEITVIDLDGNLINVPDELAGLSVKDARVKTVELLEVAGKLVKQDSLTHSVGTHDRCGTVIEPLITEQWFLRVKPLVEPAVAALKAGETHLTPRRFEKILVDWLENLHDWNISRQIWWGIKMPIFYKTSNDPDKAAHLVTTSEDEARQYYGEGNYRAETDTFDTWFSSSQWPFITLLTNNEFERFYPTSFMGTGRDILTKWVATMMMMGLYRTGKVPFKDVYLWGMVNDEHGKKMSKSKGNIIDPLELTVKYGTDALRLALTIGITPGNDGALSEKKVAGYRNFANKVWNVARYILDNTASVQGKESVLEPRTLADKWILSKFSCENAAITKAIEEYRFSEAGERVYSLLWNDLADWYLEASKSEKNEAVLLYALETILKLAHPLAPFVTEAIWGRMAWQKQKLIVTSWPEIGETYTESANFEMIIALVSQIRAVSTELQLAKPVLVHAGEKVIEENAAVIQRLARTGAVSAGPTNRGLRLMVSGLDATLQVDSVVIANYLKRLQESQQETNAYLSRLEKQLENSSYVKNAPSEVVAQTKHRRDEAKLLLSKLDEQISAITH